MKVLDRPLCNLLRSVRTKREQMRPWTARGLVAALMVGVCHSLPINVEADARVFTSQVTELKQIPVIRPEYPVPNEPNMLYYIQRSVNSNTVVYAARLDSRGHIDSEAPVDAYWRWYNVDGHRKPLNLVERMMAYGVEPVAHVGPGRPVAFKVVALPEREFFLVHDSSGHPEAVAQLGGRWAKLVYIYLQVDDRGLLPSVTAMDLFGIDTRTGRALREHVVPH